MSNLKDGGPAFARPGFTERETESQEGMSLRDWFAGKALIGVLSRTQPASTESVAKYCYTIADSMLKEREKS